MAYEAADVTLGVHLPAIENGNEHYFVLRKHPRSASHLQVYTLLVFPFCVAKSSATCDATYDILAMLQ